MKTNTKKVIYVVGVAAFLVGIILAFTRCDGVQIYDPPMTPNRTGEACTRNGQCPFPTLCSKYATNDETGICR
jgi:hypothetical protein